MAEKAHLRQIIDRHGGVSAVAQKSGIPQPSLSAAPPSPPAIVTSLARASVRDGRGDLRQELDLAIAKVAFATELNGAWFTFWMLSAVASAMRLMRMASASAAASASSRTRMASALACAIRVASELGAALHAGGLLALGFGLSDQRRVGGLGLRELALLVRDDALRG
jgi:hypothetical protein